MKKVAVLCLTFLGVLACREKSAKNDNITETGQSVGITADTPLKTYAEISIKDGGEWVGRKYVGGDSFRNVQELEVPENHTDHSFFIRYEGPGWENNQIGFRLYLDWRNAIDIYGKKVDSLVLPYVGQDGFDSYHEPADWGQDILKAGKSMGLGGYGRLVNDTVAHFRDVGNTFVQIENKDSNSTVYIDYKGWETGNESIDLEATLTIFKEDRYTLATLTPSKAISGICTGIVKFKDIVLRKKEGIKWGYIASYGAQTLVSDTDKLGMAIFYRIDQVAEQKEGINDHLVVFKPTTDKITYYLLGAWEQEPNGIKDEASFILDLDKKLERLNTTNSLNL
ncbi:DUF4861 family protein [Arenibacter troitsensis]|uniref:DUF4861 domain-containing protein n=1 Tax=Arenibacter troitsensis TaxID=188872 RepID=A0A1X7KWP7_9FLAO|nr:DUF4861 family protein [Arenibacter troitsensis]SMG45304.1 protein of unknown function [Arenibacter troitsensis]